MIVCLGKYQNFTLNDNIVWQKLIFWTSAFLTSQSIKTDNASKLMYVANPCHLFSNLQNGRVHYIRPVGWSVTINYCSALYQIRTEKQRSAFTIRDLHCLLGLVLHLSSPAAFLRALLPFLPNSLLQSTPFSPWSWDIFVSVNFVSKFALLHITSSMINISSKNQLIKLFFIFVGKSTPLPAIMSRHSLCWASIYLNRSKSFS